jgi:hypothetical protein
MMAAPAFTKFDARAFLENENQRSTAAKVAKLAKLEREGNPTFATFAAFAAAPAKIRNTEPPADAWRETLDERAAVIEHDGGAPRAWADALARLGPSRPPADISSHRWLRFIDDCRRFLDDGWAERAATLGWGPLDLFGCDRERPFARVDHLGLTWLLNGGKITELHRDRAIIETERGARQTYRRQPVDIGRVVLAWELAP